MTIAKAGKGSSASGPLRLVSAVSWSLLFDSANKRSFWGAVLALACDQERRKDFGGLGKQYWTVELPAPRMPGGCPGYTDAHWRQEKGNDRCDTWRREDRVPSRAHPVGASAGGGMAKPRNGFIAFFFYIVVLDRHSSRDTA